MPHPLLAEAAAQGRILQSAWTEGESLYLLCVPAKDGQESFSLYLDGQSLAFSAQHLRETQIPATFFCLVDISGSIKEKKMALLRDALLSISASMREGDNMVIATLDNVLEVGQPLSTAEMREEAVAALAASHQDTNLYGGIVDGLELLKSNESYNPFRCLVILSDGEDCQDNGMTEQEALSAIEKARLPIYTVAVMTEASELEGGKILGSFARASYGGLHQTTAAEEGGKGSLREGASGQEFGDGILQSALETYVLEADLSGLSVQADAGKTLRLSVELSEGEQVYTDALELDAAVLPAAESEGEGESTPEGGETEGAEAESEEQGESEPAESESAGDEADTEPETDGEPSSDGLSWPIPLAIGLCFVLVLAAGLLLWKKRGKRQEAEDASPTQREAESPRGDDGRDSTREREKAGGGIPGAAASGSTGQKDGAARAGAAEKAAEAAEAGLCTVTLVDIPHGKHKFVYQIPLGKPISFGRGGACQHQLDPNDGRLSALHFSLLLQRDLYCIKDEQSTNGTFLNGVPIAAGKGAWVKFQDGDKVRAGGYEYRLSIALPH